MLRISVCEFEAFLDMTKTISERSYTSHHIFSKTELRACTRTYLFEAFLDPTKTLSERSNPRTKIFRRRNYAPLSQTFTGGEAAA